MFGRASRSQSASSVSASGNADADLSVLSRATMVQGRLRLGETDLLVEGRVQGSVTTEGTLYLAEGGVVCGNIAARSMRLAPGSRVEGIVRADELRVGGEMNADVMALQSLCLLKTARIDGTVLVGDEARLEVNLGAVVNASVERAEEALAASAVQGDGEPADAASIASWAAEVSVSLGVPEGENSPAPADAPQAALGEDTPPTREDDAPSAPPRPEAPAEEAPQDPSPSALEGPGQDRPDSFPEDAAAEDAAAEDAAAEEADDEEADDEDDGPSMEEKNYGFKW